MAIKQDLDREFLEVLQRLEDTTGYPSDVCAEAVIAIMNAAINGLRGDEPCKAGQAVLDHHETKKRATAHPDAFSTISDGGCE